MTTTAETITDDRTAILRWMKRNAEDHRDQRTGEINYTTLVEQWDRDCSTGEATMDSDHPAWEIALEVR